MKPEEKRLLKRRYGIVGQRKGVGVSILHYNGDDPPPETKYKEHGNTAKNFKLSYFTTNEMAREQIKKLARLTNSTPAEIMKQVLETVPIASAAIGGITGPRQVQRIVKREREKTSGLKKQDAVQVIVNMLPQYP